MVAPAFGFSFGDFNDAINLIIKAAKALRKIDGASTRYQQIALELDALVNVLQRVQALGVSGGDPALVQQIQLCAHICHVPLDRFIRKIKEFELPINDQLDPRPLKLKLKKTKDSIKWAFSVEQEVSTLKAAILPQLTVIDLLLQLANVEQLSTIENQTAELTKNINHLLNQVNQLNSSLITHGGTRSDVPVLMSLLDKLSLGQTSQNQVSVDLTGFMHTLADNLNTKLSSQDALLHKLLDQMRMANPATAAFQPQPIHLASAPSAAPHSSAADTTPNPPDELVAIASFAQIIQAVRAKVWQVVLMLFYFIPTIQRFLLTAATLCRGPTLLLSDNIHLEDALGRMISLPYEHFRFLPVLEARLRCAFEGLPGDMKVQRNQYRIVLPKASTEIVLNAQNWARLVFPGSKLQMAMLFEQFISICPRCQQQLGPLAPGQLARCTNCEVTYRRRLSSIFKENGLLIIHGREDDQGLDDAIVNDKEEIQFFKRVYLIQRRQRLVLKCRPDMNLLGVGKCFEEAIEWARAFK